MMPLLLFYHTLFVFLCLLSSTRTINNPENTSVIPAENRKPASHEHFSLNRRALRIKYSLSVRSTGLMKPVIIISVEHQQEQHCSLPWQEEVLLHGLKHLQTSASTPAEMRDKSLIEFKKFHIRSAYSTVEKANIPSMIVVIWAQL